MKLLYEKWNPSYESANWVLTEWAHWGKDSSQGTMFEEFSAI